MLPTWSEPFPYEHLYLISKMPLCKFTIDFKGGSEHGYFGILPGSGIMAGESGKDVSSSAFDVAALSTDLSKKTPPSGTTNLSPPDYP